MKTISIIQPDELGSDFKFEGGKWKVNFPAVDEPTKVISGDEGNAIKVGTDGGGYISEGLLLAYALVQDTAAGKIQLYSFPAGTEFVLETATLVSTVNLIELNGVFDDVAIDDAVITFTDADSGQTLTLDTKTLQRVANVKGGDVVKVTELAGVLTISVILNDSPDNLIQETPEGLLVSKTALQDMVAGASGSNAQKIIPMNNGEEVCYVVGEEHLVVPQFALANTNGEIIAFFDDIPEAGLTSIKADETHCTDSDWDVKYVLKSTGETVKIKTGPIVTRELIDPDVDFTGNSDEGASYKTWEEAVADRSELYIHRNVTTVKERAFADWTGLEKVHTDATELEESAFARDSSITEFVCLSNTRRILGTMVSGCQFTKLEFNEGLQKVHSECFPGCNFPGGTLIIPDSVTQYVRWQWNDDYTEKTEAPATGLTAIFGIEKLIIGGGVPKISSTQWSSMLRGVKHLEFRPGITHITGPWSAASYTCETLILPQGLLEIGSVSSGYTFGDFNKLRELFIPGTVQYISNTCFQSMEMLEKLTIERGVGYISEGAFQNFGSGNNPHPLKEFNFLGGTVIAENAFLNWHLADPNFEIVIPDTVTEIKRNAFLNHDNTKSLRFAEGCKANVGYYAFGNWFKAESLYISDSVQSINGSFGQWYRGRELYIGKGIKTLGGMVDIWGDGNLRVESEFSNWGSDYSNPDLSHLASKTIIIPDNVEAILDIFAGGSRLEALIISAGLKTLGNINLPYCKSIFIRCPSAPEILESSRLLAGIPGQAVYVPSLVGYDSVVNETFGVYTPPLNSTDPHVPTPIVIQEGDWDVQYLDLRTGLTHTLNGTVRGIIDDNFSSMHDLDLIDDIVIGASVTHIGSYSFSKSSVKRILFLGNNLKSIGPGAFPGCFIFGGDGLTLPDSLERVGSGAFATLAQLNKLTYGRNLISVADGAFDLSDKFATPSMLLPPSPTFVSNTTTTITGTALAGDTIVGGIKRGEETIELPSTPVGVDGSFTIDLSTLEEPATIQSGDRIGLVVLDIVKNISVPTKVVFM